MSQYCQRFPVRVSVNALVSVCTVRALVCVVVRQKDTQTGRGGGRERERERSSSVCVCVFLYLLYTEYQNPHSTSIVGTFLGAMTFLLVLPTSKAC